MPHGIFLTAVATVHFPNVFGWALNVANLYSQVVRHLEWSFSWNMWGLKGRKIGVDYDGFQSSAIRLRTCHASSLNEWCRGKKIATKEDVAKRHFWRWEYPPVQNGISTCALGRTGRQGRRFLWPLFTSCPFILSYEIEQNGLFVLV